MNDKLEELKLYQFYVDLLFYIYQITEKYPKHEKLGLVSDIKNISFSGLECLIDAQKDFNPKNRLIYLNKLDSKLKSLKVLVRISYKFKYINGKNYAAWSRKITNVSNLMNGWIKKCLKL